ncbi:hypothetical protein BH10BAC4_BH10BAC4_24910 [soil metagenome]
MKRVFIIAIASLSLTFTAHSQELVLDLAGFQIGQYRDAVRNELGKPMKKDKYDNGVEYEIYLLKPDTSLYMIFEYSKADLEIVWSVQVTGKDFNVGFKNLILGMDKAQVIKILGVPTRKVDVGEYGNRWEYDGTNYSIEMSKKEKLSSIKIKDESYKMFRKPDVNKLPTFALIESVLKSKSNAQIKELLSPDMELYWHDSIFFFKSRMADEIKSDKSRVFKTIRTLSKNLEKVNTKQVNEYEENIRVRAGSDPMHVVKIKKGQLIKEIVFKYRFGKYLIWEIKT